MVRVDTCNILSTKRVSWVLEAAYRSSQQIIRSHKHDIRESLYIHVPLARRMNNGIYLYCDLIQRKYSNKVPEAQVGVNSSLLFSDWRYRVYEDYDIVTTTGLVILHWHFVTFVWVKVFV